MCDIDGCENYVIIDLVKGLSLSRYFQFVICMVIIKCILSVFILIL